MLKQGPEENDEISVFDRRVHPYDSTGYDVTRSTSTVWRNLEDLDRVYENLSHHNEAIYNVTTIVQSV